MELKNADRKLLAYLYHNSREPLTTIAKEVGLSREQVDYKVNKYLQEGIIKKFMTFFDYSRFGYNYFVTVLLKFESDSRKKFFLNEINRKKNCISYGGISGKYDFYINSVFKNQKEMNQYIMDLLGKKHILDYLVIKPHYGELYPLKFVNSNESNTYLLLDEQKEELKFDGDEIKILKLLEKDGRIKLIDIANTLNISSELALYKLRKLQKNKVILGSKALFDMQKIGYSFTGLLFDVSPSQSNLAKLKRFAKNNAHINSIAISLSKPNCFLQIIHKSYEELNKTIEKLKEEFKEETISIDVLLISQEHYLNTLPFL